MHSSPRRKHTKNGLAVPVILCSLTESNHVLILAVSSLQFSQPHKTVFGFKENPFK